MADLEVEVISRGVCVSQGRVLLCRNIKGGYLYLPGGHVEFGEGAAEALAREFMEETGAKVKVLELALMHENFFRQGSRLHHELNLVFHVELASDGVTSREKKIAFEWAPLDALADTDIRPGAHRDWLQHLPEPGQPPQWISTSTA